jgi:3-oxoacyl-[acyl-carrier-protein] synthase-3
MPEPRIGLLGLGAYLPERVMTNEEWTKYVDTSSEWIVERTGIERRRLAADHESTADLAVNAARNALRDAALAPSDVDEIVVATDTPEVYSPDTASFVQARLGCGEITSYDLGSSGCAGFVLALDVARARAMQRDRRILVIGVELITRLMSWQDRNTCVPSWDEARRLLRSSRPTPAPTAPEATSLAWRSAARAARSPNSAPTNVFTRP